MTDSAHVITFAMTCLMAWLMTVHRMAGVLHLLTHLFLMPAFIQKTSEDIPEEVLSVLGEGRRLPEKFQKWHQKWEENWEQNLKRYYVYVTNFNASR